MRSVTGSVVVICTLIATALPAQQWQVLNPLARGNSACCYDPVRGVTVQFGGKVDISNPTLTAGQTWEYDGVGWTRRSSALAPIDRQDAGMAYDPVSGACVLFGGFRGGLLADTWRWDGATWQQLQPAHVPPSNFEQHLATDWLRSRVVLVTGSSTWEWDGSDWTQAAANAPGMVPLAWDPVAGQVTAFTGTSLARWNGTTWTAVPGSTTVPARTNAGFACDTWRNRLCVFGGVVAGNFTNDLREWNGTSWVQQTTPAGLAGRSYPVSVFDERRGRLVVANGNSYPDNPSDTWEWDGTTWYESVPSPLQTFQFNLAADPSGSQVLLFSHPSLVAQTFTRGGDRWIRETPTLSPPSHDGGLAFDPVRNVFLYFGGVVGSTAQATAYDWSQGNWVQHTGPQPPARSGHMMALDQARQRIVLFGGLGASQFDDTWEWDGTGWTAMNPAHRPSGRSFGGMAFDPATGTLMLYGGIQTYFSLDDFWHWTGSDWLAGGAGAPGGRHYFGMTTDPSGSVVVLHGGTRFNSPGTQNWLTDTWQWNGSTWSQIAIDVHEISNRMGMTYDGRSVVMFGGNLDGGNVNSPSGQTLRLHRLPGSSAAYGNGCGGGTGPTLAVNGSAFAGNASFSLTLANLPPQAFTLLAAGLSTAQIPFGNGCDLLIQSEIGIVDTMSSVAGVARAAVPIPDSPSLVGTTLHWQAFAVDPQGPALGLSWSHGLTTTLGN